MQAKVNPPEEFQPEVYCLRCQFMEWDDEARRCGNFETSACPLVIRRVLAGMEVSCLVF